MSPGATARSLAVRYRPGDSTHLGKCRRIDLQPLQRRTACRAAELALSTLRAARSCVRDAATRGDPTPQKDRVSSRVWRGWMPCPSGRAGDRSVSLPECMNSRNRACRVAAGTSLCRAIHRLQASACPCVVVRLPGRTQDDLGATERVVLIHRPSIAAGARPGHTGDVPGHCSGMSAFGRPARVLGRMPVMRLVCPDLLHEQLL